VPIIQICGQTSRGFTHQAEADDTTGVCQLLTVPVDPCDHAGLLTLDTVLGRYAQALAWE
jgi:hypothetical protein